MAVVKVENVSIRYWISNMRQVGLKEYLMHWIKKEVQKKEFWANKNINFSLNKGDMLGIIGMNGSGKSTLLKAVSGVMRPTKGKVRVKGNIAALLELGVGFDGELTVRENTYLRGALLGYTRKFMDETYDQIIDFAELRDFQDLPFRQLSSGMRSRLAFSIACLVQPDVLILDEVLAVGDGAFKEKSGAKMKSILDSGVTALFVSHSLGSVKEMCNKVLWLDHGEQIAFGKNVEQLCNAYEEYLATKLLPKSAEDIQRMSDAWEQRQAQKEAAKKKKRIKELEKLLNEGDPKAAGKRTKASSEPSGQKC